MPRMLGCRSTFPTCRKRGTRRRLCSSTRWWDFDPTNNRDGWCTPGEDYVTLALGRDYADVSPIRGVIHGGANHVLTVGVTVEPNERGVNQSQSQIQSQQSTNVSHNPSFNRWALLFR
jgi:hypothetical protein